MNPIRSFATHRRRGFFFVSFLVVNACAAQVARAEAAPTTPPATTLTQQAEAQLGALLNGGNVQAAAVRVGGFYGFRLGRQALRADGSLGIAALAVDADANPDNGFTRFDVDGSPRTATMLDNLNTNALVKVRYDFFVDDRASLYAAALALHDSALNLLVRLRGDVGWRQFVFLLPRQSLAAEVGAAYTIDDGIFDTTNADTNGDGRINVWGDASTFEKSRGIVAARLAVVYANTLVDGVSFGEQLEVLPNVSFAADVPVVGFVDAPFEKARAGGDGRLGFGEATVASSLTTLSVQSQGGLSLGVTLAFSYDAGAVVRRNAIANADTALSVQLGYRFY
jgi:hypothetical protein